MRVRTHLICESLPGSSVIAVQGLPTEAESMPKAGQGVDTTLRLEP